MDVTSLKGIGPKLAEKLAQMHILTVQDLLFHLPFRYEDRSEVRELSALRNGDRVLVEGHIQSMQFMGARHYLRCVLVNDAGARLDLIFFHFAKGHQKRLAMMRDSLRCFGEVRQGFSGHLEMMHPEYASVSQITAGSVLQLSPCLLPVYSTTKGLLQVTWRKIMRQALQILQHENVLPELLPNHLLQKFHCISLHESLSLIHFPPIEMKHAEILQGNHPALQRLIFEELVAHQLTLQASRQTTQRRVAMTLQRAHELEKSLIQSLPFELTNAQQRVTNEIENDLMQPTPMLRLIQGDVGSGKTIVSCIAALSAIAAGCQVALMAPTEILCEQHAKNFSQWLSPLGITVDLLLGRQSTAEQHKIKTRLFSGECQLVIGTHALFQHDVQFKQLALMIIDEQHRFGVHQRLALMEKAIRADGCPHQLIMTATPIPRTLTMTAYADLDCSVIDELPPGRKPITTALISSTRRHEVVARMQTHCHSKKQAYWICTLIDESELLQCQAAETTANYLRSELRELRVGLVHGRLKSDEKNAVMAAFQKGDIDLLVATTVVEVGVDVPNASLMVIENPERLGLSQLHQLRGRVGRGVDASYCVLLYQYPLSEHAKKRLSVMRETQDGFVIAQEDLQLRGPGDVLGSRQSGMMQLRVADLLRDQHLLSLVQTASEEIIREYPQIVSLLTARWIGADVRYVRV